MIEGDNKVDGEETKRIKQCVSFAEFVRLKRPQNIGFAKIFQRQSVVEKTLVGRRRVAAVGGGAGGRADGPDGDVWRAAARATSGCALAGDP